MALHVRMEKEAHGETTSEGLTPAQRRWARQLHRVGVELIDADRHILACVACGQAWIPLVRAGGRFRRGYRICPRGCNRRERA